jgi:hypothetical protein
MIYDIYTTTVPYGVYPAQAVREIEITTHVPSSWMDYITQFTHKTWTDPQGQQWVVAGPSQGTPPQLFVTAVQNGTMNAIDELNYSFDFKAFTTWAAANGFMSTSEYFGGLGLAVEPGGLDPKQSGSVRVSFNGHQTSLVQAPASLTATAISSGQVNLAWAASIEYGVIGYRVFRNGVQIGTTATNSYYDYTGLSANTAYTYTVSAYDSVGNVSPQASVNATTLSGSGATSITLGNTSTTGSGNGGDANMLVVNSAQLAQAGTIQSMSFYVTGAAGNLRLGIYDASGAGGGPGVLKAQTNSFTPVVGWNTQSVVSPTLLAPGTYWLAYLPSDNSLSYPTNGTAGSYKIAPQAYGAMPSSYPTPTGQGVGAWPFYATLTSVGS